jgi:hypothetical protein
MMGGCAAAEIAYLQGQRLGRRVGLPRFDF